MDTQIDDKTIRCECGALISGNPKLNTLESNLEAHKKSKRHKRSMGILKHVGDATRSRGGRKGND
jgi:hypothetical protein